MRLLSKAKNYEELKGIVRDNVEELAGYYLNKKSLERCFVSLNTLDQEKQNKILSFAKYLDKSISIPIDNKAENKHKINTLATASIYYDLYGEKIKDYSEENMALLAHYSIVASPDYYPNMINIFPKELLNTISETGITDFQKKEELMLRAEVLQEKGKSPAEIIEYYKKQDPDKLLAETIEANKEHLKEGLMELGI